MLFEQGADAVLIYHLDDDGTPENFLDANLAALDLYGYSIQEMRHLTVADLVDAESVDVAAELGKLRREGTVRLTSTHLTKAGEALVMDVRAHLGMVDGRAMVVSVCRDVTASEAMRRRLQESEERFRRMADVAPVLIWISDTSRACTWFNRRWLEFTGRSLAQERGFGWAEGVHQDDYERCLEIYTTAFDRREPFKMEYRLRRHDGEYRYLIDEAAPLHDASGAFAGYVGSCVDIEDQKRSEQIARHSEARYRALIETTAAIVWSASPDGKIEFASRQWYDYTGIELDDTLGMGWLSAIHPDHKDRLARLWKSLAARFDHYEFELPLRRSDGAFRWHLARGQLLRDDEGRPLRWIGTAVDIDDRKQAEQALEFLNAALEGRVAERTALAERQAKQLRQLAAELTRAEQSERRRLATTLHDHLQQLLVAAKYRLASLEQGGDRLLSEVVTLLDSSLEVSRSLTAQLSPPVLRDAGLVPAIEWLARWMQETHHLHVKLNVLGKSEPAEEHVRIVLFEAVRELIFNVVKHAGVESATVTMRPLNAATLCLEIQDEGVGIVLGQFPSDVLSGSGLGLRSIHERLGYIGGTLSIDSGPGRGTRVTLTAPLQAIPDGSSAGDTRATVGGPAAFNPHSPSERIRILLADDHKILRDGIASLLADQDDMEVVGQAEDGQMAVELADALSPDVVVMDITMPRLNGIEATRQIARSHPEMRVIGLSMHSEADMAEALISAGATTYLTKGGPAGALIDAIRGFRDPAPGAS
jgi:PAS domain S-box-containing protein